MFMPVVHETFGLFGPKSLAFVKNKGVATGLAGPVLAGPIIHHC